MASEPEDEEDADDPEENSEDETARKTVRIIRLGKRCSARSPAGVVTKGCRLSWLTNSAPVYEPKCRGGGGGVGGEKQNRTPC